MGWIVCVAMVCVFFLCGCVVLVCVVVWGGREIKKEKEKKCEAKEQNAGLERQKRKKK